jgi:hypothetical protein
MEPKGGSHFELPPVARATVELCSVTQLVYFPENISASLLAGAKQQPSVTVGVPATRRDSAGIHFFHFQPSSSSLLSSTKNFISTGKLIDFGSRVCSVFFGI